MYRGRECITYVHHTWAYIFGEIRELVTAQLLKCTHMTRSITIYCQFIFCAYAIYAWFKFLYKSKPHPEVEIEFMGSPE